MPKWCPVTKFTFSTFELACNVIENQMHNAEYERSMPLSVAMLPNFVRCVYRCTLYDVLPKSAALLLKCVLIVYIWPEKAFDQLHTNDEPTVGT